MTRITGLGETAPCRTVRRTTDGTARFVLPDPSSEATAEPGMLTDAGPTQGLAAMLAMQETALTTDGDPRRRRDQAARQRSQELLAALASLQHVLLGNADRGASRASVRALLDGLPTAADPALASVLRAIALRAHVELARDTG